MKSVFISAGETSGDVHGAGVVAELKKQFPDAGLFGLGGDRMRDAGLELLEHSRRTSFMGFSEVVRHLPFIAALRKRLLAEIAAREPKLVILIDYPGFHFSLLRKLQRMRKEKGLRILYYIGPQVWAWKARRAQELRALTDHIAVIFPFEVDIYEKLGGRVTFVGHPLLDETGELPPRGIFLKSLRLEPDDRVVGILPGSRKQELRRHLPLIGETVRLLKKFKPELKFVLAQAGEVPERLYERLLGPASGIHRVTGQAHAVLAHANASLVKSGSSTVEAAYFGNPFVVFYRTSPVSFAIGKKLVKVPFIAMANLLAGEEAVRELVQHEATPENLMSAILPLLTVPDEAQACRSRLKKVREQMGEPGAARRVAEIAAELIES